LLDYQYLVLYHPTNKALNYRFSLPNKLFQAMSAGLSLIVSENFVELIATLEHIPGSVFVLKKGHCIQEAIDTLEANRSPSYCQIIQRLAQDLHKNSRKIYLDTIL
jgi:hypothetical protein